MHILSGRKALYNQIQNYLCKQISHGNANNFPLEIAPSKKYTYSIVNQDLTYTTHLINQYLISRRSLTLKLPLSTFGTKITRANNFRYRTLIRLIALFYLKIVSCQCLQWQYGTLLYLSEVQMVEHNRAAPGIKPEYLNSDTCLHWVYISTLDSRWRSPENWHFYPVCYPQYYNYTTTTIVIIGGYM